MAGAATHPRRRAGLSRGESAASGRAELLSALSPGRVFAALSVARVRGCLGPPAGRVLAGGFVARSPAGTIGRAACRNAVRPRAVPIACGFPGAGGDGLGRLCL